LVLYFILPTGIFIIIISGMAALNTHTHTHTHKQITSIDIM